MQIKKRLRINHWISLIVIVFIALSLGWSFWEYHKNDLNENLVLKMNSIASERISLRDDYLLYREARSSIQWQAKTETLRRLMDTAAGRLTTAEDKALLLEARKNFDATASGFSAILEKEKREGRKANRILAFDEATERQIGQIFLKSYTLIDNIERLYESVEREATSARNKSAILIIIFFILGGVAFVVNSSLLNKLMTKRLMALNEWVVMIGSGNLDYKITLAGDDELTDLSRANNEMIAKLKQSYTSVENLQREIFKRQQAQEDIKKLSLHQRTLLDAIPDIIMEVDKNKIYTWANEPGIEFFGKAVIGKAADFYFVREQNTYDKVQPLFNGSNDLIYLESWQKRKDGQERLLAWWCHVLKDTQENVTGALSSARDITDQNMVESQREVLLAEIRKLNEELEQRVTERTAELTVKTNELERINKVFVDRELKMRELKTRIAELEKKT